MNAESVNGVHHSKKKANKRAYEEDIPKCVTGVK